MMIVTRLPAAVRVVLLACLLLPGLGVAAPAASAPAAPTTAAAESGLPLLRTYLDERRADDAAALSKSLLAAPAGADVSEVLLLTMELERRFGAGDFAGLEALEPRVQAAARLDAVPASDRARMLHQLMTVYFRVPRLDDAIATSQALLALLGDKPSEQRLAALRAQGAIYATQGQAPAAIESLMAAEKEVAALGLPADTGILRNLAGIFINLGEFDRAIEYAERAEAVQRATPTPPDQRMGILSIVATAHIGAGHFEQGRRWSQEALAFGREHKLSTSGVLNNYATLLRDEGRHAEALAAFEELLPQVSPADSPEVRGVVEKNIGETLVALGRRSEAAEHLQRARELYVTADVRPRRLELYPVLVENLEALGRTAEALDAMQEFKALSDEVISAESKTRIGDLENTLELARKEKALAEAQAANDLQRAENAALQASQSRATAINLALFAGLVAIAALLALLWRTYRLRTRSHRELTTRNAEIEEQRSALQQLNANIEKQSREDALTGLGNRRLLQETIEAASPADTGVLVMADLDHFKTINDTHGHDTGDRALRQFADALRAVARQGDLTVRWGGEEFVWLCRGASADQGPALCERLLRQLSDSPLDVDGKPLPVEASLGFVPLPVWPDGATNWDGALRVVDFAVYCSKGRGRRTWTGFVGVGNARIATAEVPAALEDAGQLRRIVPGA